MATLADSGDNSEKLPVRDAAAETTGTQKEMPWSESAVHMALTLKQTLDESVDSAVRIAGSGLSEIHSSSSAHLQKTLDTMESFKTQYAAYEDLVFGKIKEGIVVAASHPAISCGIAAAIGIGAFKRPRRFIVLNARRFILKQESLLSNAEAKVNQLRQSVNVVKNESIKLEGRVSVAEREMEKGRTRLGETGREMQNAMGFADKIEREALGLKDTLRELPSRQASQFRSKVSSLTSQVKQVRKALSKEVSKIINYRVPI